MNKLIKLSHILKLLGYKDYSNGIISLARESDQAHLSAIERLYKIMCDRYFISKSIKDKEKIIIPYIINDFEYSEGVSFSFNLVLDILKKEDNSNFNASFRKMSDGLFGQSTYNITLYIKNKNYEYYEYYEKYNKDGLTGFILDVINFSKYDLVHELSHMLSDIKASKRKGHISKGGTKQYDLDSKEYTNSTDEIQARLSEVFSMLDYHLDGDSIRDYIDDFSSQDEYDSSIVDYLINAILTNNPHLFMNKILEGYGNILHMKTEKTNRHSNRKVTLRILDRFQHYRNLFSALCNEFLEVQKNKPE